MVAPTGDVDILIGIDLMIVKFNGYLLSRQFAFIVPVVPLNVMVSFGGH